MRILDVRTTLLTGPSTNDPFLREARQLRSAAFIEVLTDGPTGIGETYAGYYVPEAVPVIVDFFKPILIGQDVDDIPELWRRMYHCGNFWCRVGLGAIVLAGIEAALWDLKGKLLNQPVHALLGGARYDRLPCYATGGPSNYPKQRLAEKLDHYFALGFRGAKIGAGCYSKEDGWYMPRTASEAADFEGDKAAFIRRHAGKDAWLMIDGHMGNNHVATWDPGVATAVMQAVEPAKLFFFEEPLHYTDLVGYRELCRRSNVPIAGGECLTAACEWTTFVEHDCFDVGQPDASFAAGLTEFLRIARMLHERGRKIATHAWGAGGSLMQNVHAAFAAPNTAILEIPPDYAGLHSEVIDGGLVIRDGYVLPPDRPGLGIVLTDDTRRRYPFRPGSGEFNSVAGKVLRD
jgi:L-alanine-DL-glutamate epimerase-like enolase superfamily enzyme